VLTGLLCAVAAALAYGSASVLQSIGIRRAGAKGVGASGLAGLKGQPLYFIGLALDGAGFFAMVVALQFLPLFLVQAVVAASVGVTAGIAALAGATLGRSGLIALAAAGLGLGLLSLSAAAESGIQLPLGWRWILLASAVPIGGLTLVGPKLGAGTAAPVLGFGAGLGFSVVAIASRSLRFPHPIWSIVGDPAFWAVIAAGLAAVALFALALQAGSVTTVSAVTFTTETVVPAAVGLAFLGDFVRNGYWPVAVAGFVLAVVGAIALARFAEPTPQEDPSERCPGGGGRSAARSAQPMEC